MAGSALLKAYLEWQSEMGTEEIILPHPFARRSAPAAGGDSVSQSGVPARGLPARGGATDGPAPDPEESGGQAGMGEASQAGYVSPPGLFESLAQALVEATDAKSGISISGSQDSRPSSARGTESSNLPVFQGLEDFRAYLEKHSHLLHGEGPAVKGTGVLEMGAEHGASQGVQRVPSVGPEGAPLALIGFAPGDGDAAEGKPFGGEIGALLEKMMRAIRLDTKDLYLGNLIKVRVAGKVWSRRELARIVPLLYLELELARIPAVLLLGQECAQTVLKTGKTLDELRQETHRLEGREFFVTYHPEELVRKEELKRKAWEDLQWLQRRMAEAQARA